MIENSIALAVEPPPASLQTFHDELILDYG
jgi:hypothetical protein